MPGNLLFVSAHALHRTDVSRLAKSPFESYSSGSSDFSAPVGFLGEPPSGEWPDRKPLDENREDHDHIVGPSGRGKTALISIFVGTLDPTGGEVLVLGEDLGRLSRTKKVAFRARNLGFVFQQFNLLPALTAPEKVAVPLVINGAPRRAARAVNVREKVLRGDTTPILVCRPQLES